MRKNCILLILLAIICICFVCGCTTSFTIFEFASINNESARYERSKTIYFNESTENITLNGQISLNCGKVTVCIVNKENNTVWENSCTESCKFDISLNNVTADSEYTLKFITENTQNIHLLITSSTKLVQDKHKPQK